MNKNSNYVLISCVAALFLTTTNCTKNGPLGLNDNCGAAWTETVSVEISAYTNALTAYSESPTTQNCASVKATAKNYFDALGDALKCVPTASRAEINKAISEAKADVDKEDCD